MNDTSFFDRIIHMLGFPFRGPGWGTKLLVGLLLSAGNFLIPLVPALLVNGYCVRIMRRILEGEDAVLPEWDDWGGLLRDGFAFWGAGILYSLPMLALMLLSMAGFFIPWMFIFFNPATIRSGTLPPDSLGILFGGLAAGMAGMCLAMPLGLITSVLEMPATSHLVARRSFAAAFRIQEWWPVLRAGLGGFMLVVLTEYLLSLAGTFVLQLLSLTVVLVFVAPITYGGYLFLVVLYGNSLAALAYREGKEKLERKPA